MTLEIFSDSDEIPRFTKCIYVCIALRYDFISTCSKKRKRGQIKKMI